ncbi:MAG TPA: response regulator transcription factor [Casimicrobiaceae bacterium]|nr:response regulator transcription factor [Casimicrobiaceae bacterium]
MLVDDHEVVRLGLRALFKQTGRVDVVAEAGTVADAVERAAKHRPDLVLMDLRLPDGTGLDACRDILSANPGTRVLFLTSHSDEEAVTSTILAGAAGYLLKEIGSKALIDAIETVYSGESILDPKVTKAVLNRMSLLAAGAGARRAADEKLSPQERRILGLVVEGKTNKEIAKALDLSDKTVKNYLSNAFQKLNVSRRSQAAALFERDKLAPS